MNHQDLINTCIFEQIQGLLFSDLSGHLIKRIFSCKTFRNFIQCLLPLVSVIVNLVLKVPQNRPIFLASYNSTTLSILFVETESPC